MRFRSNLNTAMSARSMGSINPKYLIVQQENGRIRNAVIEPSFTDADDVGINI